MGNNSNCPHMDHRAWEVGIFSHYKIIAYQTNYYYILQLDFISLLLSFKGGTKTEFDIPIVQICFFLELYCILTTYLVQINNYEIVVNFFHISHNLTWYSAIVHRFTRIYPVCLTYELFLYLHRKVDIFGFIT